MTPDGSAAGWPTGARGIDTARRPVPPPAAPRTPGGAVVKVGGGLWAGEDDAAGARLRAVCAVLASIATSAPLLVVPGGGRFAEAVRSADRAVGIDDRTAHRMALLGMDQHGLLLAALLGDAPTTRRPALPARGAAVLLAGGLGDEPGLPASWDVTSDAVAVWAAARAGLDRAVLVKPAGWARGAVDPWAVAHAPRLGVALRLVAADDDAGLRAACAA